jgi:beta-galactosidase
MPILSKYQFGNQGTVIAVQVENELDFYDCGQVNSYISTLRDYTLEAGIKVPVITCAGQCDIERSGGFADGVTPAVNLYPGDREKSFEDKVNLYVEAFRSRDIPLCITETNRSHFILRRELIAGAKMMSAYNQVGGTNFGFTTSVNNWGKPLTYLTHDYDFAGMINAQGEYLPEYNEALLLGGIIKSFEKGIGQGKSVTDTNLCIQGDCMLSNSIKRIF